MTEAVRERRDLSSVSGVGRVRREALLAAGYASWDDLLTNDAEDIARAISLCIGLALTVRYAASEVQYRLTADVVPKTAIAAIPTETALFEAAVIHIAVSCLTSQYDRGAEVALRIFVPFAATSEQAGGDSGLAWSPSTELIYKKAACRVVVTSQA